MAPIKFVILDQLVIRVLRESDRQQFERIDKREAVERQPGMQHFKSQQAEGDDVVSEDEGSAIGYCIKPLDEIF